MFLLDTNAVSELIRHPGGAVERRAATILQRRVVTSIVVAAELRFGLVRNPSERLERQMIAVLATLPVLPLGAGADHHYGQIRADLARRGTPIGGNDLLIAAHAPALGATLVTENVREFGRVDGLAIENWLRD